METPKQREAFLTYFKLGSERSLIRLHQDCTKVAPKIRVLSLRTLKGWSARFNWVERAQRMDKETTERVEELAVREATLEKSKILQFVKNVFIRANKGIVDGTMMPSVSDVKKAWEIMHTELGQEVPGDEEAPMVNIFLTKNQNILNLVHEASEKLKKALMEEIPQERETSEHGHSK